jgi:hypothetical protein
MKSLRNTFKIDGMSQKEPQKAYSRKQNMSILLPNESGLALGCSPVLKNLIV